MGLMLAEHPFRIDVGELVHRPGTSKRIEVSAEVSGWAVGLGRVAEQGSVHVAVLVESLVEGILVTGRADGVLELECARCLAEFEEPFQVELNELFAYAGDGEDVRLVEGDWVDLVPAVRDEVLLAVPPNPLHDPGCRGLCAVCGQDLNQRDCGHRRTEPDPRWEPLRRLQQ